MATKNGVWLPLRFRINYLGRKRYCNFRLVGLSAARDLLLCAKPLFIGALVCLRREPGMAVAGETGEDVVAGIAVAKTAYTVSRFLEATSPR